MNVIEQKRDTDQSKKNQELILSVTASEEIIQFNKQCEQWTGYRREEVLHKKLSEVLLPKDAIESWKTLLTSIQKTMWVDEFILSMKTRQDTTFPVSWNGILIKDANGSIKDICLFGKPLQTNDIHKQTSDMSATITPFVATGNAPPTPDMSTQKVLVSSLPFKQEKKKIVFSHEKQPDNRPIDVTVQDLFTQPLETMSKTLGYTSEKLGSINTSLKELSRKYDHVTRRIGELEKKDRRFERTHKNLGKHMRLLEKGYKRHTQKQKETTIKNMSVAEQPVTTKKLTFFSDIFGYTQQHQEIDNRTHQLDARTRELDTFEAQLTNERKLFNSRVEEFCRWREKLGLLESAIETRRQELIKQEEVYLAHTPPLIAGNTSLEPETMNRDGPETPEYHEILDKIPQSAAIVQRGILKQINSSFATLLGYSIEEVIEKSFFDFIALDGLADVEKYYLDRLKGEGVSAYKTVFSTKDNNKIAVEVSIKQTIYNGEKAEIAIITHLEKTLQ